MPILFTVDQSAVMDAALIYMLEFLLAFLMISFTYSCFSENISENSDGVGEDIYNSLWYKTSLKQQKSIILIIGQSQREFRLPGLGIVGCSFVTFLAVTVLCLFYIFFSHSYRVHLMIINIFRRFYEYRTLTLWYSVIWKASQSHHNHIADT